MASKSIYEIYEQKGSQENQIDVTTKSSDAKKWAMQYSKENPDANYSIQKTSLVGVYSGGKKVPQFETKN